MKTPKMYNCSLCGRTDSKTFREAREGKMVAICEVCSKKQFPSGAYTLEKDKRTGKIKKVDFLEKLLSL